jgi:hypothetical protein
MEEWARTLGAVVIGFLLASLGNCYRSYKARRNARLALFKELKDNYRLLNRALPQGRIPSLPFLNKVLPERYPHLKELIKTPQGLIPPLTLVAVNCDSFQFSAYESYLDRLYTSEKEEAEKVKGSCGSGCRPMNR